MQASQSTENPSSVEAKIAKPSDLSLSASASSQVLFSEFALAKFAPGSESRQLAALQTERGKDAASSEKNEQKSPAGKSENDGSPEKRKSEPLSQIMKEIGIPANKDIAKQVLEIKDISTEVPCDTNRQSPWITEKPIQNTCDIPLTTVYPQVKDSVAQIFTRTENGPLFGTAFKLCDDASGECFYVSNAHVTGDQNESGIQNQDGKTVDYTKIVAKDVLNDLVLIEPPPGDTRPGVKIGEKPKKDDPVFTVGHPYGFPRQVISAGKVTLPDAALKKEHPPGSGKEAVVDGLSISSVNVFEGNSGGPEFNKNGEVVGVKVISLDSPTMKGSGSLSIASVKDLVERYKEHKAKTK